MSRPEDKGPVGRVLAASDLVDSGASTGARRQPACYTSFDGDYIAHVGRMCWVAAALDYAPINPEAVLGYYVSTEYLGNQKSRVMRACLAAEFKADEFWIFTPRRAEPLAELSEGVVAEYLLWRELRPDGVVRHLPVLDDESWQEFKQSTSRAQVLDRAVLDNLDHEAILSTADAEMRSDLEGSLLAEVRQEGQWPVAFVSSDPRDDKHLDWARRALYSCDPPRIPFVPTLMMPGLAGDFMRGVEEGPSAMQVFRETLLHTAEELWAFVAPAVNDDVSQLHDDVRSDLGHWASLHDNGAVRIVSWDEVGVPKYANTSWSLTQREQSEIAGEAD